MSLPWDERKSNVERFVVVDVANSEVVGFADSEDEVIKIAMREVILNKKEIEVFESTGFSSWKQNLKR